MAESELVGQKDGGHLDDFLEKMEMFFLARFERTLKTVGKIWRMLLGQEYGFLFLRFGIILGMPALNLRHQDSSFRKATFQSW